MQHIKTLISCIICLSLGTATGLAFKQIPQAREKGREAKLSRFTPSFNELYSTLFLKDTVDQRRLKEYIRFLILLDKASPEQADIYGMLGYCYAQVGDHDQAVEALNHAVFINEDFFWHHFNLGLVYFQNEDYLAAIDSLEKAVSISPETTINNMRSSANLYLPLLIKSIKENSYSPVLAIKDGHRDSFALLAESYRAVGQDDQALMALNKLQEFNFNPIDLSAYAEQIFPKIF